MSNEKDIKMQQEEILKQMSSQFGQLQQYVEKLDINLSELASLKESLKEFEKTKKGSKIYAPIANGIFVEATLDDSSTFLVNVGKGIVVKKTIKETLDLIKKQEEEISIAKVEADKKVNEFMNYFQQM